MPKSPCRLLIHRPVAGNMAAVTKRAAVFMKSRVPFKSSFKPTINRNEQPTTICMIRITDGSTSVRSSSIPSIYGRAILVHRAIRMMGKKAIPPIIRALLVSSAFWGRNTFFSVATRRMLGMTTTPNRAEMKNGAILMRNSRVITIKMSILYQM